MWVWIIGWLILIGFTWKKEKDIEWFIPIVLLIGWPLVAGSMLHNLMEYIHKEGR